MKRLLLPMIVFLSACQFNQHENESAEANTAVDSTINPIELSDEDKHTINKLISAVAPPLELTYIISDLNLKFSSSVLHPADHVENYNSNMDQAVAIGIYGADLVYCLVYNRNDMAETYLKSIHKLADKLNLQDVIDFEKLSKLSESGKNTNDIAMEFSAQMEKVYNHLDKTNQLNLSALMSFGSWTESIYIAAIVGKGIDSYSEEMIEVVYYESLISENYLKIFNKFNQLPGYEQTFTDLEELSKTYKQFEVKLEKVEPKVTHGEDMTQVVDISKQTLIFDNKIVDQLTSQITTIREDLIK